MAYRVLYGDFTEKNSKRRRKLTAAFFLLFLICVHSFWPEGADVLRGLLTGVKNSALVSALNQFADELITGDSSVQAFSDFLKVLP